MTLQGLRQVLSKAHSHMLDPHSLDVPQKLHTLAQEEEVAFQAHLPVLSLAQLVGSVARQGLMIQVLLPMNHSQVS